VPSSFFISDLHLHPARPDLIGALEGFLLQHSRCDAMYILGDLFEAWIGDDDDTALAAQTARLLRSFSDGGPALYLMHGNRDFLLGQAFCARAGAILLPDPSVVDLYGTPTLLMHGDSLCTTDVHYQTFRRQARTVQWQADMLGRSLSERRQLAVQLRAISRESLSNKAEVRLPGR
jgi:UDP-2,3-diacylglucosamine hydrolase